MPGSSSIPPSTEECSRSRSQKPSRAAARQHPPSLRGQGGGGARGATSSPSAAAVLGWRQEAAHPTASPCACALGGLHPWVPRDPQHPPYTLAQDAGGVTVPSVPHPLLSPTQGAPTSSASPGPRGTVPCGCSHATLQLSPAGAKWVLTHRGVWGLRREQLGTGGGRRPSGGGGEHGSVPGPGAG